MEANTNKIQIQIPGASLYEHIVDAPRGFAAHGLQQTWGDVYSEVWFDDKDDKNEDDNDAGSDYDDQIWQRTGFNKPKGMCILRYTMMTSPVRYIDMTYRYDISIVDISTLLKNINIDIDIDMVIFENIDIDMVILENIDIDIDKAILQNIDIDKISNRFKFGISNRAISGWHQMI